ncbi:MAG TPA: hypothetical protein VIV60_05920 [Polyangiaceae bacterium]
MAEKVCVFGSGLVGIISQREGNGRLSQAPALLLWNVGMNHRVGPYRYFVDLARRVAGESGTVLRFDVSGLGDSELQPGRGSDIDRAILDVGESMNLIEQRTGIQEFVLVGFCSGVDAAHRVAVRDPRVVGVVQVEGYAYRTPGFYLNMYKRLLNRRHWERYLVRKREKVERLIAERNRPAGTAQEREPVFTREYPTRERYRDEVAALARRKVGQLFVYVGCGTNYLYEGQFHEMYGSEATRGAVDVVYYEDADHTFSRQSDRDRSIEAIVRWMITRYGSQ